MRFILVFFLLMTNNLYALTSSETTDLILKSAIPVISISPMQFTLAKLSVGVFINYGGEWSGNYAKDMDDAENGFGAILAYEFPKFEAEAFSKKLAFHKETYVAEGAQNTYSYAHLYGIGARYTTPFKLFSLKVGYLIFDITNKVKAASDGGNINYNNEDSGFYYGGGFRFYTSMARRFSIYTDATGYFLKKERIHLVDGEIGIRFHF